MVNWKNYSFGYNVSINAIIGLNGENISWDETSVCFTWYGDQFIYGYDTHYDLFIRVMSDLKVDDDTKIKYGDQAGRGELAGRIFQLFNNGEKKYIFTFWFYPNRSQLKEICKLLYKPFSQNLWNNSNTYIEVLTEEVDDFEAFSGWGDWHPNKNAHLYKYIPIKDYTKPILSYSEKDLKQPHEISPLIKLPANKRMGKEYWDIRRNKFGDYKWRRAKGVEENKKP